MSDYRQAWADAEAARLADHVQRTAAALHELADRYVEAHGHTGASRHPPEVTVRVAPGPRVPVRVDVVDIIEAVERFVDDHAPRVRGALRVGLYTPPTGARRISGTVRELRMFADGLGTVYGEDHDLGNAITRGGWSLHYRVGVMLGIRARPFQVAEACGSCGIEAVWVDPASALMRCGNCDMERAVDLPVVAHSTETATGHANESGLTSNTGRHQRFAVDTTVTERTEQGEA